MGDGGNNDFEVDVQSDVEGLEGLCRSLGGVKVSSIVSFNNNYYYYFKKGNNINKSSVGS